LFLPLLLETVATDEEDAETRAERGVKFLKKLEVLCFGFGTRYSTSLMKRRKRGVSPGKMETAAGFRAKNPKVEIL